jgi:hypothetical protein
VLSKHASRIAILLICLFSIFGIVAFPFSAYAADRVYFYKVQPHDLISEVLYRLHLKPIYGKKHSLQETLDLNPNTLSSRGDFIYPNETIKLPVHDENDLKNWASISADGFVIPLYSVAEVKSKTDGETRTPVTPVANLSQPASEAPSETHGNTPEVRTPSTASNRFSLFSADVGFTYFRLDSNQTGVTGGTATLISNLSPEFAFGWHQHWSKDIQTSLDVSFASVNFTQLNGGVLEGSQHTVSTLSAGVQKAFGDSFSLAASLGNKSALYVRGLAADTLVLEAGTLMYLGLSPSYTFLKLDPLSAGVRGSFSLYLPATNGLYQSSASEGFGLSVFVQHDLDRLHIKGEPFYKIDNLVTSQANYNLSEVGIFFGISYQLGGDI